MVDIPKRGVGTTNDAHNARRFFENPVIAPNITGRNEELIHRFGIIFKTITSGFSKEFKVFCLETDQLFVNKCGWYYISQTVHKILIHGTELIKIALLPVGMRSDEAQEARNKDYKNLREHHTRKVSRTAIMTDLLNLLLDSTDPLVSSLRVKRQTKSI